MSTPEEVLAGTSKFAVVCGDATDVLKSLPADTFHVCYCDPPYGLSAQDTGDVLACLTAWLAGKVYTHHGAGFKGKDWDAFVPGPEAWREVYRVLKPGAFCVAYSSTRTVDLLGIAMRLGGLEPRNGWAWVYGSGFPKNLDVSKAIDKMAGAEREVLMDSPYANRGASGMTETKGWNPGPLGQPDRPPITAPATDAAKQWDGYGTDVKPSYEPLVVTRKPLDGTVASNVLAHGCGALNIDGARVGTSENLNGGDYAKNGTDRHDGDENWRYKRDGGAGGFKQPSGRFPANLALVHDEGCVRVLTVKVKTGMATFKNTETGATVPRHCYSKLKRQDHGEYGYADADGTETGDDWRCTETCAVRVLGEQSGDRPSTLKGVFKAPNPGKCAPGGMFSLGGGVGAVYGDTGTAAQFFYQAKASANDRLAYLTCSPTCTANDTVAPVKNVTVKVCPVCNTPRTDYQHPTVKPYELALYHAKLLSLPPHTRPVAIVPFCGTGVEARALMDVGYRVIAVDIDPRHVAMTRYRLSGEQPVREAPVTVAQESTPASPVAPLTLDDLFGF